MGAIRKKPRRGPPRAAKKPQPRRVLRQTVEVEGPRLRRAMDELGALIDTLDATDPPGLKGERTNGGSPTSPVGKSFTHWRVPLRKFRRKFIGR